MVRKSIAVLVPGLLLAAGCQSYTAKPLESGELLRQVEERRRAGAVAAGVGAGEKAPPALSFAALAGLLLHHGPDLVRARERHRQARIQAGIATPLPDPVVTLESNLGVDLEEGRNRRLQPGVGFGFAIPLWGRLAREDDLHRAQAEAAGVELQVAYRLAYLELRESWMEWLHLRRVEEAQGRLLGTGRRSLDLIDKLVQAGTATPLDRGLMEVDLNKEEAERLATRNRRRRLAGRIAALTGLRLPPDFRPAGKGDRSHLHPRVPGPNRLRELLVDNNPELGRLRAAYEVAERRLRLEVTRQYPDLELGTAFGGEPGETKKVWGLSIGITLPLFDRNRRAIAAAAGERRQLREEYKASLGRLLATLDASRVAYRGACTRCRFLADRVLPRAEANRRLSRRALEAGTIDPLKQLEVERTARRVRLDLLEARRDCRRHLAELERVLGLPLDLQPEGDER